MLVYALFVFSLAYAHGFQVETTEGVVDGSTAPDGNYFAFYGIPYAGPTSGANRFKAPVPPSRYGSVLSANNYSSITCAQPTSRGLVGVEDCLTLNIFTKTTATLKPVVVWLNADEYTTTNATVISVRNLVEQNIVFVSMNFRLSVFGFLCLGVQEAPGNAGLKDVIQGLKWIKTNIAHFGGDQNSVTLMGHASGAAMVDLLTLSPLIENLAHKAIVLSGSSLAPWAVAYNPIGYAESLGAKLGYTEMAPSKLAKHLVDSDINVLNTALNEFKFVNNTPLFAPCIENQKLNSSDSVLREAPMNILRSGKYAQIPVMYGYTNREGTMRADEADYGNWLIFMQANFTSFLPVDLDLGKNKSAVVASIRDFYFANDTISMALIEDYLDYEGDTLVLLSVIKAAKERVLTSKSEIRLLEFAYEGTTKSNWVHNQISLNGAAHGAFLNYIFDYDLRPEDQNVSKSILKLFTSYASSNWTNDTIYASWVPLTKEMTTYLYYGGNGSPTVNNSRIYVVQPRFNPHIQRTTFWDDIYDKYYAAPPAASSSNIVFSCIFSLMLCQLTVWLF